MFQYFRHIGKRTVAYIVAFLIFVLVFTGFAGLIKSDLNLNKTEENVVNFSTPEDASEVSGNEAGD